MGHSNEKTSSDVEVVFSKWCPISSMLRNLWWWVGHMSCWETFPGILRCPLKTGFTAHSGVTLVYDMGCYFSVAVTSLCGSVSTGLSCPQKSLALDKDSARDIAQFLQVKCYMRVWLVIWGTRFASCVGWLLWCGHIPVVPDWFIKGLVVCKTVCCMHPKGSLSLENRRGLSLVFFPSPICP